MVKNHFLELENNEMQYNLKLQEKMNKILRNEIDRLKGIMKKNNIVAQRTDEDDNEEDAAMEEDIQVNKPPMSARAGREESSRQPQQGQPSQQEYDFSKKQGSAKDRAGLKSGHTDNSRVPMIQD